MHPILHTVIVTGDTLRVGDVVRVGGIPCTVVDVRDVPRARKRVQFEDGNSFVVARTRPVEVVRVHVPRSGRG